jgi:hypothetical protein
MAAGASASLTVSAFVASGCNVDNASMNFVEHEVHELKSDNQVRVNSLASRGPIPQSVTCKNARSYETYPTKVAIPRYLNDRHVETFTNRKNQVAITISY